MYRTKRFPYQREVDETPDDEDAMRAACRRLWPSRPTEPDLDADQPEPSKQGNYVPHEGTTPPTEDQEHRENQRFLAALFGHDPNTVGLHHDNT